MRISDWSSDVCSSDLMRALGGPGYLAELTGNSAALIGARDFAEQIYDLALLRELVRVGRDMVQGALDTSADVNPRGRIEEAEIALYRVAADGQVGGGGRTFGQATMLAVGMAERAIGRAEGRERRGQAVGI